MCFVGCQVVNKTGMVPSFLKLTDYCGGNRYYTRKQPVNIELQAAIKAMKERF